MNSSRVALWDCVSFSRNRSPNIAMNVKDCIFWQVGKWFFSFTAHVIPLFMLSRLVRKLIIFRLIPSGAEFTAEEVQVVEV